MVGLRWLNILSWIDKLMDGEMWIDGHIKGDGLRRVDRWMV